ncbi:hypothetical protein TVAG_019360 [Trichomonas vaginalis G3]|uniref:Uncharacterized protein n=1 Tax=Trichomonas vaginalis (strain ATCC PRA-98 / G3) TaxID=412133 RepID=A2DX09_TRIV3|nr:ubiquitinyl hydrolase protein [Trichomonas vaginalis G3]EAY15036.1 hypothetical protein TVAG_019360 [Trichomonas vaginalis G3]KAI5549577.1 ubiquitinyl hydrolase protein [Trichomonas vaginalis G3]|eukprot:XP_001327259.1 hypothetical protein [Trichomonas vaginalis G3]
MHTDWFSKLDVDEKFVFIYRLNAIGKLLSKQKYPMIFETTGGAENLIRTALMFSQGVLNFNDTKIDIIYEISAKILKICPEIVSKFAPKEFTVAANTRSPSSILFFAEACSQNSEIPAEIEEIPNIIRELVIDEKCQISESHSNISESVLKILMSLQNFADIIGILCNLCEPAFAMQIVTFPQLVVKISLQIPSQYRNQILETFIEAFLKRFNFPASLSDRISFKAPTNEFANAVFAAFTEIFPKIEEVPYHEEIFHILINNVLLNRSVYYEPSLELMNLIMAMLDRFTDLVAKSYDILKAAKTDNSDGVLMKLNSFVEKKILSEKSISSNVAYELYQNVKFINLVLSDVFSENTWEFELQKLYSNLLIFPAETVSSKKFDELFNCSSLKEVISKFSSLDYLSNSKFDENIIYSREELILSLTNKPILQGNVYPSLVSSMNFISKTILKNVTENMVYTSILSRMEDELSNPSFCLDRFFEIISEVQNDAVRLHTISSRIQSVFETSSEITNSFIKNYDHFKYLLDDREIVRKEYATVLITACRCNPSQNILNDLLEKINPDLCQSWAKLDSIFIVASSLCPKSEEFSVAERLSQFVTIDLENYTTQHENEDIYVDIDHTGLFNLLSRIDFEEIPTFISAFLQIIMFNEMFKSKKHLQSFIRFISKTIFDNKILQEELFGNLNKEGQIVSPSVASQLFVVNLAINDGNKERRNKQFVSFFSKHCSDDYSVNFVYEFSIDAPAAGDLIFEGFFGNLGLWIETWLFSWYENVRQQFCSMIWSIIDKISVDEKIVILNSIFEVLLRMISSLEKIPRRNYIDIENRNTKINMPDGDFYKFFRSVMSSGFLNNELLKNSNQLYKYVLEFQNIDSPTSIPRIHLLFFIFKAISPDKGPQLFLGFDYPKFLSSLSNFDFENPLISPELSILYNIIIRTPRSLIPVFYASSVFRRSLPYIFNNHFEFANEFY